MQKYVNDIATVVGGSLAPLASASCAVYLTGTTTLASLYSDNGVTALTNPTTSSATGRLQFYAADGRYDIVCSKTGYTTTTITDVLLEDPAQGQDLYYLPAGTGAVSRTVQGKLQEAVSVTDFGAVGDGVTDDTAAIQAAIDANQSAQVFFPSGTYLCSSAILLTDTAGHNFQGQLIGDRATITFTHSTLSTAADKDMAHGFQAFPLTNGVGGDITGMRGVLIQGLTINCPTNGCGIYLANCQRTSIIQCIFVGGRYNVVEECCINTVHDRCYFSGFINAGLGLLMTNDTARVWYGSATPTSTYWNDSPQISNNGFSTDVANGILAMILDYGSQSESIRNVTNCYLYSGTNAQTQYGILGRNCNYNIQSSWFENINYPVRFLMTNANEGGSGTTITGVTAAQPNGTYTVGAFPDGFSYTARINNNHSNRAVTDYDVSGVNGPCFIGQNISYLSSGTFLKSLQAGSQRIVDGGNSLISSSGTYKNLTYNQYVHWYQGDTTGTANALAGDIGQYIESNIASGSAVALTTATTASITSISLTAGDWEVWGTGAFAFTGATAGYLQCGISTSAGTFLTTRYNTQVTPVSAIGTITNSYQIPRNRFQLTGTTTIYLLHYATFTAGSVGAFGVISARRIR